MSKQMVYIAAYHGVSLMSRMIKFFTWSDISHVAAIRGDGEVIEAWKRVRHLPSWRQGHTLGTVIDLYLVTTWAYPQHIRYWELLREQVGKRYDWLGLLGFVPRRDIARHNRWFCSELLHAMSVRLGAPLLERVPSHRVTPAMLTTSPLLDYVGSVTVTGASGPLLPNEALEASRIARALRMPQDTGDTRSTKMQHGLVNMQCGSAFGGLAVALPNGETVDLAGSEAGLELVGMPNMPALESGADGAPPEWLEVPYADVPIAIGETQGIQRLNRRVADGIVRWFGSWRGRLVNRFAGFPVYRGHPDAAYFRERGDTDEDAYAWIQDIQAGADALRLRVDWTPPGTALLANKVRKFFSPYFLGEMVGRENGVAIYEPRSLKSVGLVNSPNWPVAPLVNAGTPGGSAARNGGGSMSLLEKLRALLGLEAEATDETALARATSLVNAVRLCASEIAVGTPEERGALADPVADPEGAARTLAGLVNARLEAGEALVGKVAELEAAAATAATELANAQAELETATTARATEREARALALVNAAVEAGRITPGEKENWQADLVNATDFDARARTLAALQPRLKTKPVTTDLGRRDAGIHARREERLALVNKRMEDEKEDYLTAYAAVKKAQPALFADSVQAATDES